MQLVQVRHKGSEVSHEIPEITETALARIYPTSELFVGCVNT